MKLNLIFIVWFILFFMSCKPDPVKPAPEPLIDSVMKIVWKQPIGYSTRECSFVTIYNNTVVYCFFPRSFGVSTLIGVDKNTGNTIWFFNSFSAVNDLYQEKEILYFRSDGEIIAFSIIKGDIIWRVKAPINFSFDGPLSFSANKLWKSWCDKDSTVLFSIAPTDGHLTKIKTLFGSKNEYHEYKFGKAINWMHPNGDSILVLTSTALASNNSISEIMAFNLTADSIYFRYNGFLDLAGIRDPLIIGNQLIILDNQSIKSISLIEPIQSHIFGTGLNLKWNLPMPIAKYYSYTNLLYQDGLIMTRTKSSQGTNGAIAWIDPLSGKMIKNLNIKTSISGNFYFKDNWMYYYNNDYENITKVDVTGPKIIWNFSTPDGKFGFYKMALDADNDLIYTMGEEYFYCYKIIK